MVTCSFADAEDLCYRLLVAGGLPSGPARRSAWAIVAADAMDRGSHGMLRLPYYLRRLEAGGINPLAEIVTLTDTGPVVSLDGNGGLGHFQAFAAAELATQRAQKFGVGAVSVSNSNHCGVLGLYVVPMLDASMVGLAFTNGPAVMPAWGGRRPVLSTSPIAAGIPTRPRASIVDLATTTVARGRVAQAASQGETIPNGWAFDSSGAPTNDAEKGLFGMLAPMAGAKGFALAFLVEALTGAMVGPALSMDVADPLSDSSAAKRQGVSHLAVAFNPRSFDPSGRSDERLCRLAAEIEGSGGRLPGSARLSPGELEPSTPVAISDAVASEVRLMAHARKISLPAGW